MIRRRNVITSLTGVATAFALLLTTTVPAFAADAASGSGNGLKVENLHNELTIQPGSSATVDVFITNITGKQMTYDVFLNDFVASGDESGNPALILNDGESAPAHSLRKFVPALSDITLKAGERKDVKVPISIPADAVAGGYFGAVRFAATTEEQAGRNVALSASVASLILVKVPGDYKEQMNIESLDARRADHVHSVFTNGKGIDAAVRFKNTGDIQEVPFGKITVTKMGGGTIYSTEVNSGETAGSVLPDSVRKFTVPLKNIGSFGKYTIQGDFGYGKGQTLTATTTFYVLPLPVLIGLLVLIVLLIVAITQIPRMMKRHERRVLRRAGRK